MRLIYCQCGFLADRCRLCSDDPRISLVKLAVRNSKRNDLLHDRMNDIDTKFVLSLFKDRFDTPCPYCQQLMHPLPVAVVGDRAVTLQRKDNRHGHVRFNVTLCCYRCNQDNVERSVQLCMKAGCSSRADRGKIFCLTHSK